MRIYIEERTSVIGKGETVELWAGRRRENEEWWSDKIDWIDIWIWLKYHWREEWNRWE